MVFDGVTGSTPVFATTVMYVQQASWFQLYSKIFFETHAESRQVHFVSFLAVCGCVIERHIRSGEQVRAHHARKVGVEKKGKEKRERRGRRQ